MSIKTRTSGIMVNINVEPATATTTTWNSSDISTNITLSNGNLTLTISDSNAGFARSIASASNGKKYWELTMTQNGTPANNTQGIANSTFDILNVTNFTGSDLNSIGWGGDGPVYINSVNTGSIQTWAQGDTICIAADLGAELIWFRTNGGNWNNNGAADPATGVGGIDFSSLNAGPWFAIAMLKTATDNTTANFGATAYAQTVPSGFGNW